MSTSTMVMIPSRPVIPPSKITMGLSSPQAQKMFKNVEFFFKLQLKVCNFLTCVPYEWDYLNGRMRVLESKNRRLFCKVQVAIQGSYTALMVLYFLTPTSLKSINMTNKMLATVFLACLVCTSLLRWTIWTKKTEGVALVNSFINFEDKYLPATNGKVKGDKAARILMTLGLVTSGGLASFMCFILLVDPCNPPHLGYILYKKPLGDCAIPAFRIKIAILAFDTWIWACSISAACFYTFHIFFLDLRCMDLYLQLLTRGAVAGLSPRFKNQDEKDKKCFGFYRQLRLLGIMYNNVLQPVFIPTLVTTAIFVIIICLYACIKLHKVIPMPGFAFFPLLCCNGFSVIFITTVVAGVFNRSEKFFAVTSSFGQYGRRTWYRKIVASSGFIKIRFGSANYIDKLTPLVFINFCSIHTVTLMLMT